MESSRFGRGLMKRRAAMLAVLLVGAAVWWRVREGSGPGVFVVTPERREDLRFLDASKYGIAYYAATLKLGAGGEVNAEPRWSPLEQPFRQRAYLVALVEFALHAPSYGDAQRDRAVAEIAKLAAPDYVRGVQLDFPVGGDGDFFRGVAADVRGVTKKRVSVIVDGPCVPGDGWADEIVPRGTGDAEACGGGRMYLRSAEAWTPERLVR